MTSKTQATDSVAKSNNRNYRGALMGCFTKKNTLIAVLVMALGAAGFAASTAAASRAVHAIVQTVAGSQQNCTTGSNGVTYCNEQSQIQVSQSDQKVESLTLTSSSVMQLRWAVPGGAKPQSTKGCRWVTGGTNSYYNKAGQLVKIPWKGKRAYICPSKSSPTGWRKYGGPPHWEPCGNIFWPPFMRQPKKAYRGPYKVVQKFTYTAKLSLTLTLHGTVTATASCSVTGASASGTTSGSDTESIRVTGTGVGTTQGMAIASAQQQALNAKAVNDLQATVKANASLNMQAKASAICQETTVPTTTVVTTVTTTTTVPTTTTTTTTPPTPTCYINQPTTTKSDPYTAYVQWGASSAASSVTFSWGGNQGSTIFSGPGASGTVSHTYPVPAATSSPTWVQYNISASATINGQTVSCGPGTVVFNDPAPVVTTTNGTTTTTSQPPPQPGG